MKEFCSARLIIEMKQRRLDSKSWKCEKPTPEKKENRYCKYDYDSLRIDKTTVRRTKRTKRTETKIQQN